MTTPQSNDVFFKTPFCAQYWREAKKSLKSLRLLVLAALLVAGRVAITGFPIMVGENLKISFGFFLNALGSLIYGPYVGILTGFATDILGVILHPMGPFFPGYTLTAMAGSFVYALFLSRARITVRRIVLCKLCVNLLVNVGLNCLWSAMLYSKGYRTEPCQNPSHAAGGDCHFADLSSHHAARAVLRRPHAAPAHQTHPLLDGVLVNLVPFAGAQGDAGVPFFVKHPPF